MPFDLLRQNMLKKKKINKVLEQFLTWTLFK